MGPCRYNPAFRAANCSRYQFLREGDEGALKEAVATIGPISVAIDARRPQFYFFHSGGLHHRLYVEAGSREADVLCIYDSAHFRGVQRPRLQPDDKPRSVSRWLRYTQRTRLLAGEEQVRRCSFSLACWVCLADANTGCVCSWGVGFGDQGYIRMARNKNDQCGIAQLACFPVM